LTDCTTENIKNRYFSLYVATITERHASLQKVKFLTEQSLVYAQTEGCSKLRNLDNFAALSHGILRTGLRNLAKFSTENLWPYLLLTETAKNDELFDTLSWKWQKSCMSTERMRSCCGHRNKPAGTLQFNASVHQSHIVFAIPNPGRFRQSRIPGLAASQSRDYKITKLIKIVLFSRVK